MRTEFYIFRHGETELNRQKRWQGSGMDYDLTENGIVQAQKLAAKLQGKGIEIIFSSPLRRAFHTAKIAAAVLGIPVAVENDLRECFYGEAEGRLIADLQREVPQIVNNWNRPQFWDLRFEGRREQRRSLATGFGGVGTVGERKRGCDRYRNSRRNHGIVVELFRF